MGEMPSLSAAVRTGVSPDGVNPARTPARLGYRAYVESCPYSGRAADNGVGAAGEDEDTT